MFPVSRVFSEALTQKSNSEAAQQSISVIIRYRLFLSHSNGLSLLQNERTRQSCSLIYSKRNCSDVHELINFSSDFPSDNICHQCSVVTSWEMSGNMIMIIVMIILIHKQDTIQITTKNKQQSSNLSMPVVSYKKLIYLIIN